MQYCSSKQEILNFQTPVFKTICRSSMHRADSVFTLSGKKGSSFIHAIIQNRHTLEFSVMDMAYNKFPSLPWEHYSSGTPSSTAVGEFLIPPHTPITPWVSNAHKIPWVFLGIDTWMVRERSLFLRLHYNLPPRWKDFSCQNETKQ